MTERIGIVGLGRMGAAMARRLAAQGCAVTGWTRSGADPRAASAGGYATAATLESLVAASDIILTSLFDDAAARDVLGRLAGLDLSGRLVVETSTIAPEVVRAAAPAIEAAGGRLIDAPVSGGPEMVADGSIGIYLGGAEADVARFLPIAGRLSGRVVPVGALGAGAAAKIVNNVVLAGAFQATLEGLRLGSRMGLPLDTMLAFLAESPAATPMFRSRIGKVLGTDNRVGFTIDGAVKDNALFVAVADALGEPAPTIRENGRAFRAAQAAGLGDRDVAALARFLIDRVPE